MQSRRGDGLPCGFTGTLPQHPLLSQRDRRWALACLPSVHHPLPLWVAFPKRNTEDAVTVKDGKAQLLLAPWGLALR